MRRLSNIDLAVIVFGANFVVSVVWFIGAPIISTELTLAYGSTAFAFLTLFVLVSFIRIRQSIAKSKADREKD